MADLQTHLYATIRAALQGMPEADRRDVYVVSLLVYDEEDDPRRPTVTVGYNTEARAAAATPEASSESEARWNYAMFLQNELVVVCSTTSDPDGAALVQGWAVEQGYWYSDDDEAADFDATIERGEALTAAFITLLVEVVRRLHRDGVVEQVFGDPLPMLIHEFEYYGEIARQNLAANPPGVADAFAEWVGSGSE